MTNKSSGQPAFPDGTLSTQREGKDVLGRVHVAVVANATNGTFPLSYSESTHTFRTTACYRQAARANLSRESLINVHERGSVPAGFVPELGLEHCPTGVIDGLGHPRFDESGRTYIADRDQSVVFSQTGRGLVYLVTAAILYLGVDRAGTLLVSRSLGGRQLDFVFPVVLEGRYGIPIAASGQCLQPEVDSDLAGSGRLGLNLDVEADVPLTRRVLDKSTAFGVARKRPTFVAEPAEGLAHVGDGVIIKAAVLRGERDPPESTARSTRRPEPQGVVGLVPGGGELMTDRVYGFSVKTKVFRRTGGRLTQIKMTRPLALRRARFVAGLDILLKSVTVIPHLVDSVGVRC